MLMIPRVRRDLRHLSFRDLICEDPAHALTLGMDLEHDACRRGAVQGEELFEHVNDKLHGSVIIVEQHHLVEGGLFDLRPCFFNDDAGQALRIEPQNPTLDVTAPGTPLQFKAFLNNFIRMPCQLILAGRRIIYRLLAWNPWLHVFLRGVRAIG